MLMSIKLWKRTRGPSVFVSLDEHGHGASVIDLWSALVTVHKQSKRNFSILMDSHADVFRTQCSEESE